MPATGSPSPGGDNPERLEIMQYDGEVWDDGPPQVKGRRARNKPDL